MEATLAEVTVREGRHEGSDVVFIPLQGKHLSRGPAIVDRAAWPLIQRTCGSRWVCMVTPNDAPGRVVSTRKDAVAGAQRLQVAVGNGSGDHPVLLLSRFVTLAGEGDKVISVNGNPMDLRRCNLEIVNGSDLGLWYANVAESRASSVEVG